MAGIKVQKRYTSSNLNNLALSNNWMVLVLGVTNEGPLDATLVQSYDTFLNVFGQPVSGVKTHSYVKFLINSGVNVLFKRIVSKDKQTKASYDVETLGLKVIATDEYIGEIGNSLNLSFEKDSNTGVYSFVVSKSNKAGNKEIVESYAIGIPNDNLTLGMLLHKFIVTAVNDATFNSHYIQFKLTKDVDDNQWSTYFSDSWSAQLSGGGTGDIASLNYAISVLSDEKGSFWTEDKKLLQAMTYHPMLRFITTGGIIAEDKTTDGKYETQEKILKNLGQLAMNANTTFRVLVDYPFDAEGIEGIVRNFATSVSKEGKINPAVYAYFGDWGSDGAGVWLPGSAGFLSALGLSSYNVYNRRIAGKNFTPAFTSMNNELYLDTIDNWQAESAIQLNPIVVVDAQNNFAVMGSSTLAMPTSQITNKNPEQALDVVLVSDYITALLNNTALESLEVALDRLSLASVTSTMNAILDQFVTSGAITRYELNLDTTVLGKLTINCTLYFAIGLEEVELIVTSVYDTESMQLETNLE